MGKSRSSTTNSTSTNSIDPEQRRIYLENYQKAQDIAAKPYTPYEGQKLAGFSSDQLAAFDKARGIATSGLGADTLQQAVSGTQRAAGYAPSTITGGRSIDNVGQYMNPYLDAVAGETMNNLMRARDLAKIQGEDAAIQAKAYGGSRHGVADAEGDRNFYETAGKQLADIYGTGYNTALTAANTDINRNVDVQKANETAAYQAANLGLSGSKQLADMSNTQRQQQYADAAMLEQLGATQQAQTQKQLDDQYARWLEANNEDMRDLGLTTSVANSMPILSSTTTGTSTGTQTPSAADSVGRAIGTIGTLMSFLPSDKNIKSGIKGVSEDKILKGIEKTPVSSWMYDPAKGGPADGMRHTGPMAQDVKKNLGLGDGRSIPVVDAIGTQFAATKALAKKVNKLEAKAKKKGAK